MAETVVRKDLIGRELAIGNAVAFAARGHYLEVGCIKAFTPKMVKVEYRENGRLENVLRYSYDLSLLDGPALVEYQLRKRIKYWTLFFYFWLLQVILRLLFPWILLKIV